MFLLSGLGFDYNLAVTSLYLTHYNLSVYLGNNCRVRWVTSLKQLCNTWKTTGDIARFTNCARYLYEDISGFQILIVLNHDMCANRHTVI